MVALGIRERSPFGISTIKSPNSYTVSSVHVVVGLTGDKIK